MQMRSCAGPIHFSLNTRRRKKVDTAQTSQQLHRHLRLKARTHTPTKMVLEGEVTTQQVTSLKDSYWVNIENCI